MTRIEINLQIPAWYLTKEDERYTHNITYEECLRYKGTKQYGISLDFDSYLYQTKEVREYV